MTLLTIQFLSSFWMMVVIWFVQIVHYPLFQLVPKQSRIDYSQKHQLWISFIVMPAMLIELGSLLWLSNTYLNNKIWIGCSVCLAGIWLMTFLVQVPCHERLLMSPSDEVVQRLIHSNWVRTILWTLKTVGCGYLFFQFIT